MATDSDPNLERLIKESFGYTEVVPRCADCVHVDCARDFEYECTLPVKAELPAFDVRPDGHCRHFQKKQKPMGS